MQKAAYENRISDWSSDVCSSDLAHELVFAAGRRHRSDDRSADCNADHSEHEGLVFQHVTESASQPLRLMPRLSSGIGDALPGSLKPVFGAGRRVFRSGHLFTDRGSGFGPIAAEAPATRSEEHTSELQSLMRLSYAGFCLKKKKHPQL